MKKILITTYYFYPEITPRAFRAYELAKEFAKRGYMVEVIIPIANYDYSKLENDNMKILTCKSGFLFNTNKKDTSVNTGQDSFLLKNILLKLIKKLVKLIYLGGKSFEYGIMLNQLLRQKKSSYDVIISIGLPISVHFGTALFLLGKKCFAIADYGDPFSLNKEFENYWYYKYIEKLILKKFDYITVPTVAAIDKYIFFKDKNRIKVIPQGFDFRDIHLAQYIKNDVITFAYAGVFYKKIRNPRILFDFLVNYKSDFKFIIYTDCNSRENMDLIKAYMPLLGEKLVVRDLIPRIECLFELSKMDFIINQNNLGQEQVPSKIIDYALTKRPVFTFNQNVIDEVKFINFLNFNFYQQNELLDINQYNIINIVNLFESLHDA
jgi:hypothetical protein